MPRKKPTVIIPQFLSSEIMNANEYAKLLWNGISYETGKTITSDRQFLIAFGTEFQKISNGKNQNFSLSQIIIKDLINVALLRPMYRKQHELDFNQLETHLQSQYVQFKNQLIGVSNNDAVNIASNFVVDAGKAVVKAGVSQGAGYRVPFLSRVLFFAAPDMLIFNYANRLAEHELNFQSRPHIAYPFYAKEMLKQLRTNWTELSKYNIPTEKHSLPEPDIQFAYNTYWWARRVLDIALLIKYNVFVPVPSTITLLQNAQYTEQEPSKLPMP